ncbi:MAG: hypothetical protein AB8B60_08625 [Sulfitobacter sp.]
MFRLASALYSIIATALAGSGVIAVLSMGYVTAPAIIGAAAAGAVIALPVAWIIAKEISKG